MKNTIQLYIDDEKKIKGYPVTSPDRVVDENGKSVQQEIKKINDRLDDIVGEGGEIPGINGGYDDSDIKKQINAINKQLENIDTFNVKRLGAKGNANFYNPNDGFYYEDKDFTVRANDDTNILQNIINSVGEKGGGVIKFPKGNYLITVKNANPKTLNDARKLSCLLIKYNNISLVGENGAQIIQVGKNLKKLNNDYSVFNSDDGEYFFRGHTILIGNEQYPKIKNTTIKNLIFNGTCEPIILGKSSSWTNKTNNLLSWDTTHKSIYYCNKEGNLIEDLTIDNCIFTGYRGEVIYGGGNSSVNICIKNNIIEKSVTGISCDGDMIIENNLVKDISTNAIEIAPTSNLIIKNNTFKHCFSGVVVAYYKNGYKTPVVQIHDNTLIDCQKYGLMIAGVSNVLARKNTFIDCGVSSGYFDDSSIQYIGQCALLFQHTLHDKDARNCMIEDNTFIIDSKKINTQISVNVNKTASVDSFLTNIIRNNILKRSDNAINNNFYFIAILNINNQITMNLSNIYNNTAKFGDIAYEYSTNVFTTRCYPYGKYKVPISGTQKDVIFTGDISCDNNYVTSIDKSLGHYITCPTIVNLNLVIKNNTTITVKAIYMDFNKQRVDKNIIENRQTISGDMINMTFFVDAALKGRDTMSSVDGNLFIRIITTNANDLNYDLSFVEFKKLNLIK